MRVRAGSVGGQACEIDETSDACRSASLSIALSLSLSLSLSRGVHAKRCVHTVYGSVHVSGKHADEYRRLSLMDHRINRLPVEGLVANTAGVTAPHRKALTPLDGWLTVTDTDGRG